jgi:hypothetical protein
MNPSRIIIKLYKFEKIIQSVKNIKTNIYVLFREEEFINNIVSTFTSFNTYSKDFKSMWTAKK